MAATESWQDVLNKYGWSECVLIGGELDLFLEAQEDMLREVLLALELIQ